MGKQTKNTIIVPDTNFWIDFGKPIIQNKWCDKDFLKFFQHKYFTLFISKKVYLEIDGHKNERILWLIANNI
jgi:hypothetical protein